MRGITHRAVESVHSQDLFAALPVRKWQTLLQEYFGHFVAQHWFKIRRERATTIQTGPRPDSIVAHERPAVMPSEGQFAG
jgi:hypothetical protein